MDEKYLKDLWNWTNSQDRTFKDRYTFDTWSQKIKSNEDYKKQFYGWVSNIDDTFEERRPYDVWSSMVSGDVKKKEESALFSDQEDTSLATPGTGQVGLSGFTRSSRYDEAVPGAVEPQIQREEAQVPVVQTISPKEREEAQVDLSVSGMGDEIFDAIEQGLTQGGAVDPSLVLMIEGKEASEEEISKYINAYNEMEKNGPSRSMQAWREDFEKTDKGIWGFISSAFKHPLAATEIALSSVGAMINKASGEAAGVTLGVGTATGAAAGGLPGAISGLAKSIPNAYIAAATALETSLSFAEFLKEEVEKKGLKFDEEGVSKVLEDKDAMFNIRARAAGRGITIGIIDRLTMGVASGIVRSATKGTGRKVLAAALGTGVEMVGGATGEAAARAVAGQEMDVAEIGFEAIGEIGSAPVSIAKGILERPSYKINGEVVSGPEMAKHVREAKDADFAGMKIEIKNDNVLKSVASERKETLRVRKEVYDSVKSSVGKANKEDVDAIVDLELRKKELANKRGSKSKEELKNIDSQIDEIYNKIESEDYAVQEQTTSEVPVQPEARVGEEVAQGTPQTEPEVVTEEGVKEEVTPEVEQEVLDLEAALNKSSIKASQFQIAQEINDEELSKSSGTTQVATTVGSYVKAANKISDVKGDILDYGAGLGLGTDAMSETLGKNVESFELNPERWKGKSPVNYTNSNQINKKFDGIVSLNVVNVVPKDVRDFIVKDIFTKLNVGGKAVISSRGFKGDIDNAKNFVDGPEDKSYIIKRKKDGKEIDVYQKGFDGNELVDYIKDLLGDSVEVKKDNTLGKSGVIITKTKEDTNIKPSLSVAKEPLITEMDEQEIYDKLMDYKNAQKTYNINPKNIQQADKYKIDVIKNKDLVDKVDRVPLDILDGKTVNFVVLDKAAYDKNKNMTSGVFGALSNEYYGKIAHSVGLEAQAKAIANASAKADYTVGIIMGNAGIDSNIYMYKDLVLSAKETGKEKEIFKLFKERVKELDIPSKSKSLVLNSESFDQLQSKYKELGSETARKIIQSVVPSKNVKNPRKKIFKILKDEGIFIEDMRFRNEEQATQNIPSGSPFIIMELQDYKGNKITTKTSQEAIIDDEIRKEEGIQEDENYSYMLRGKVTGVFEETTPVYNIVPELAEEYVEAPRLREKKIFRKTKGEDKLAKKSYIYRPYDASVGEGVRLVIRKLDKGLSNLYEVDTKTPIASNYKNFISNLSTAFPSINVVTDKKQFEERKQSLNEFSLMSKNQKIYGFVDGETGSIYLNPTLENYNTPIHEYGHVWLNVAKHARPDLYNKGLELIKDSEYYTSIKNNKQYQKLSENMTESQREEYLRNEALATAIGDRGEAFVKQSKKAYSNFKNWMNELFAYIKSLVGLSKYTAEQVQNITMKEFLDGVVVDLMSGNKIFADQQSKNLISDLQLMTSKDIDENSLYEIVQKSRDLGFGDQAIKIVLQKQGFKVKEINEAMSIPYDILSDIPLSFGNMPGGMVEGAKIYKEIMNELKKKAKKGLQMSEITALAQGLMKKNESFKTLNDTLQKELLISLDKNLMNTENKDVAKDIKEMKRSLKERRFAAREAQDLKINLRNFVRSNMPKTSWTTKEVNTILREITDSKINKEYYKLVNKPEDDIRTVMYKVIDMINEKNSKMYMSQIEKLMSVKEEKKVAGRIQGRYTPEGVDRIKAFKEYMSLNEKSPIDQIDQNIETLKSIQDTLSNKQNPTDSDFKKMEMVNTAIMYNEALLMDNKEESKAQSLYEVSNKIKAILSGERSEFVETQKQKHEYYISLQEDALQAITGEKINLSDEESVKSFKDNLSEKKNIKDNKPKIKKFIDSLSNNFDYIIKRVESLEGLLDRITIESSESFGGKLSEIILDKINESARNYKQGKNELTNNIRENAKRIYGKDYKKILKENNKKKYEIYTNKTEVESLVSELNKTEDKKEKRKISQKIKSKTIYLTQNQMYYHYNQYKDLANRMGYEEKENWGDNTPNIMEQINQTLTPKVIEWADWQVNEFFPSVYDRYNSVYREIYKTNMPWNSQYAGRLLRESMPGDIAEADLFNQMSTAYQTNIGSQSTKARVKNKRPIMDANGDSVLIDYISDMEYFRAYAESMRDISKIYRNDLVKKSIVATTSEDTYNVIFNQSVKNPGLIAKVLNRNLANSGSEGKLFNSMTRNFVTSALGFNPTIFLKQMTSALAFADYIGYVNWNKYALKELKNGVAGFNTTWKEMYKNSPELQDRYDKEDFGRILETYTREAQEELSGGVNMGKVVDVMMYLVKKGDMGGVMGSIPNYSYYKDTYTQKNPTATEQDAIDFAIRKVEREIKSTQQDQDIQNKDFYQTGNWYQRWLSMFQSSGRSLLRKEIISIRNLYRKLITLDKTAGKGTLGENIRTFLTYHVAIPMFFQYVALGLPGLLTDWDEGDEEDLKTSALIGNFNSIFAIGDIISSIKDFVKGNPWAGDARGLPIFELTTNIAESVKKFKEAKTEEAKNKYALKALSSLVNLTGIPATQINKMTQNYRDILEKDYKNPDDFKEAVARFLGYTDYQIKPAKEKKSKSSFNSKIDSKISSKFK